MIGLIVALVLLGVLMWVVETMIPMDPAMKRIIQVVALLCVLIYVARFFGVF